MREAGTHSDETLLIDVAQTPEGAFAVDEDRRIVFWNDGARALLGYAADEVLGCTCCDIFAPPSGETPRSCPHCAALARAESGVALARTAATMRARDGTVRRVRVLTMLARNATGTPRAVHLLRDLDESVRDLERLVRTLPAPPEAVAPQMAAPDEPAAVSAEPSAPRARRVVPAPRLTRREREVLRLLGAGLSTVEIAATLDISPITARNHVTSLIEKLEVKTRLQAVVVATRRGLI